MNSNDTSDNPGAFPVAILCNACRTFSLPTQTTGPSTASPSTLWSQPFSSFMIISIQSFKTLPLSFSLKCSFQLLLIHLPPSTSLLSIFNHITSLDMSLEQIVFIHEVSLHSSYCSLNCLTWYFFHAFIPPLIIISSIQTHDLVCIFLPWYCLLHLFIPPPCISLTSPPPLLLKHIIICL